MTRKPETWTTCWSFFVAALKANPAAAAELRRKLPAEDRWMRLIGTAILTWGGYDTAALRETLSDEDKRTAQCAHHAGSLRPHPKRIHRRTSGHAVGDLLCHRKHSTGAHACQ